ncbi:acetyltransferase [Rhizobiales bacterium GAS191]|nr:acetyltransferase [Rhizobiales bacterium GAS113]SED37601.1 acetyltransferase [Rhizobiales bacterium GAS191]
MQRDVTSLIRPRVVAVLGASANRRTQGNGVIQNLQRTGFDGRILPIHATAETVDGLAAVATIDQLPRDTDVTVVAIPAPGVTASLKRLEQAGVRSAMVFTNGFSAVEEGELRRFAEGSRMIIHGPNCMGLINFSEGLPLYPSTITDKAQHGKVALIAQSGSAAISLMNSTATGFSKVITMGSEFQVTAPDYMRWLAEDDRTQVIGIVLESIKDPESFAEAASSIRAAGKSIVVLKVGRSAVGALAVQAHTGALVSHEDAYGCFFARCGIPTVEDYDQLTATLECFATTSARTMGRRIGIVGISGGETALACDVAAELGIEIAAWSEETSARIRSALSGSTGQNPLDLGATVHHTTEQDAAAIDAILEDPQTDALLLVQDAQASLTPTMLGNYTPRIQAYGKHGQATAKPVVLVSPTSENTHPRIAAELAPCGVPVLRGLRNGLVAMRNLATRGQSLATSETSPRPTAQSRGPSPAADYLAELAQHEGPLPGPLAARILAAYGIPLVRSVLARSAEDALRSAEEIGYPLVAKISSPDVAHRSDIGAVELGIADKEALADALERILRKTRAARPEARIDGFELQEELMDRVEAMLGFIAAPPFGAVTLVGTGGTLVELEDDRAVGLSPISEQEAARMIAGTRLGARLGGYRNLITPTDPGKLASLVANLSQLAHDLSGHIRECDLNPVLIRKGSGDVRVVDALMIAGRRQEC